MSKFEQFAVKILFSFLHWIVWDIIGNAAENIVTESQITEETETHTETDGDHHGDV